MQKIKQKVRATLVCLLALGSLLPVRPALAQATIVTDRAHDKQRHIEVVLAANVPANVTQPIQLTFTATPQLVAPDLRFTWTAPETGELLGGAAEESAGSVPAYQSVQQTRQLRLSGVGVHRVSVRAGFRPDEALQFGATGVLFFTVKADGTITASDKDPSARTPMHSQMPMDVTQDVQAAATRSPQDDPCFTVSGVVTRIEKGPTQSGLAASVRVPVRNVQVEMREEDTLFDDSYGKVVTDNNGAYQFSFCDDDGVFDDELELYVRLRTELFKDGNAVVEVEDSSWIDEVYEYDSGIIESEGGTYTINFSLNDEQSGILNIADAVLEAWTTWNNNGGAKGNDATFDGEAEVHWEAGYGDTGSYYNGDVWNEMTIADDPSDPDQWDDSVIMHEWGHMADDYYGCDDNGGGPHNVDTLVNDLELSWGEGYPDFWQSVVRDQTGHPDSQWYLDFDINGAVNIGVNLETYDSTRASNLLSDQNELAIAAMLWDLYDSQNDGRTSGGTTVGPWDRVAPGQPTIQEVYTDPAFESNGFFDDDCTASVYLQAWKQINKPTDAGTAEAVTKNLGKSDPFNTSLVAASQVQAAGATTTYATTNQPDYRWWKQLNFIVDNSASMGQAGKLNAVKTVMKETVNDIVAPDPKGVEVQINTFNNTTQALQNVTFGQFFPEGITPRIDQLGTIGAADGNCQVSALNALSQAIQNQRGGQAWVYTDGDTTQNPSLALIKRQLNDHQVRGSFALLGGCGSPARKNSDVSGDEESYLELAADGSQSGGVVPYLLTALGSGGQFLFVNKDQLPDAADILRAQLANSAGAGKWSDYVSDSFTYRWDKLTSREYQWFPAESLGQAEGQIPSTGYYIYNLPTPFSFYGAAKTSVGVNQDGVLEFDPCTTVNCSIIRLYRYYLDVLNNDMQWNFIPKPPAAAQANGNVPAAPAATNLNTACKYMLDGNPTTDLYNEQVCVFSGNLGSEWHIISTQGYASDGVYRAYQIWLNTNTGEIRYEYDHVRNEAANAEIGLRYSGLGIGGPATTKLLVSNKDVAGAQNGMGYKFTPAPPQPTKTYTVNVDSLIQSVGFMQTGYSGDFMPMTVTDPDGNAVNCADTVNVLCLTVDHNPGDKLVQYVQVNVNGHAGKWHATVDAGASGQGTFSFTALAASELNPESPTRRLLPSVGKSPLQIKFGRTLDGNTLTGWLQKPNGVPFGDPFTMFDDGAHNDGRAGDGVFGWPDFTPPGRGVGYLWVKGSANGVEFERADPSPFNFQPFRMTLLDNNVSNNNAPVQLRVQLDNLDSHFLCFKANVTVPVGWTYQWDYNDVQNCLGIPAGQSHIHVLTVTPAWPDAISGTQAQVAVAFAESEEGTISASDTALLTRRRPPAVIEFDTRYADVYLRPNSSDVISLTAIVMDDQGGVVADGTAVNISTSLGNVTPVVANAVTSANLNAVATTVNGRARVRFTPGATPGDATVTAQVGALSATTVVHIRNPIANHIDLAATPTDLSGATNSAALIVTVRDRWGDPVAGQTVRIGTEGDGEQGLINGSEVMTATTNAQGQVQTNFTKVAGVVGNVGVRAELLATVRGQLKIVHEDRQVLQFDAPPTAGQRVFLPLVTK